MGPERNFLSLSGNLSRIFGKRKESIPIFEIWNGMEWKDDFLTNFLSFPFQNLSKNLRNFWLVFWEKALEGS